MKIGINGFGRIGRLLTRAAWDAPEFELALINEPNASAETLALLLEFDSVQGAWDRGCRATNETIEIADRAVACTAFERPQDIPWGERQVDLVVDCSGAFRTTESLRGHLDRGASRILVSAPVKDGPPNVVVGVNDDGVDFANEQIVTAASCTTNCLAPIVRVLHDAIGIARGHVTTIHNPTNTQSVHDAPRDDPRRARAAQLNLVPTSTNSATAVTMIIPELAGKLDSIAVRAPVMNSSIVDLVFESTRDTTVDEVNRALSSASERPPLVGILGFETRPLVSSDFARDPRSAVVDALSTRVVDRRLVKVLAWYDNEWGYANRMVDLVQRIAAASRDAGTKVQMT